LQQKPDTKVKRRDKCKTIGIYGEKIGIPRPLARSSTISDRDSTVDEEAMDEEAMDEEAMDKEREDYENSPKRVNKSQRPKNYKP